MANFRTRARAVDMLGRQQIAGVPTAISELFKNAHDAYADRVEVDYYRSEKLFVLRDDGLGMTENEFLARWMTIGTESKLKTTATGLGPPPIDPSKHRRAILGEKGIGRLAISAIGPQVLVLSQSGEPLVPSRLVAAYIHWGFFELAGVDLDEIEIPVATFPAHQLPGNEDLARLVDAAERTLDRVSDRADEAAIRSIRSNIEAMRTVDVAEVEEYVPALDLRASTGTHFIIVSAYETLDADINVAAADEASSLEKLLVGFTNTMTPGHPPPLIDTAFRDYRNEGLGEDLVDKERFFTPAEFANADHQISGEFDLRGQFAGTVSVYGEPQDYEVAWPRAQGQLTRCGPFEIYLAAVQPELRATTLPPEEHQRLLTKTRRFGGLYIYRDGIRVLPYGDVDYDWLEIEKRRTKGAAYYYFSHRNLFGAVLLTNERNGELSEKAGREGFRENSAYRQLRSMMESFLVQVAGDFFRDEATYGDRYQARKGELARQHEILRKRESSVRRRRETFRESLRSFFVAYDENEPQERALELAQRVERDLAEAEAVEDPAERSMQLLSAESQARDQLRDLEESYRVIKPRGVGMPRSVLREFDDYQVAYAGLKSQVFDDVRMLVEGVVNEAAERSRVHLDRRLRLERSLEDLAAQARRETRLGRGAARASMDALERQVAESIRRSVARVEEALTSVLKEFASTDLTKLDDHGVFVLRERLERQIVDASGLSGGQLGNLEERLRSVNPSGVGMEGDELEAIEQRNLDLEDRAEYDLQLAQLGMAVDVINHEFDASIRSIRNNLRRLQAWADANEDLYALYSDLRSSFDHLDAYLTLFTPLHRRLNRQRTTFDGADVAKYLRDLFEARFERHEIQLLVTDAFARWAVTEYPSSFYPVFVNLVDNAVFWLGQRGSERVIALDAEDGAAFVSNSGPRIVERRREAVFDQGVSYRPGGRGLGLFISREVLRGVGFELQLVEPRGGWNVTFRIARVQGDDDGA